MLSSFYIFLIFSFSLVKNRIHRKNSLFFREIFEVKKFFFVYFFFVIATNMNLSLSL